MSVVPAFTRLVGLSQSEADVVDRLSTLLSSYMAPNFEANAYYEAKHILTSPGFTIPEPVARRLAPVAGAPGTVVDVIDERLEFLGWDDDSTVALGLDSVYDRNELDSEAPAVHLDALIYGTSFVRVGAGDDDEPLVTMHSPNATTGLRDPASRRLVAAWTTLPEREPEW